jgi:rhodanese-related sulfurtransferase
VAVELEEMGYNVVGALKGGWDEWVMQGYPTVETGEN